LKHVKSTAEHTLVKPLTISHIAGRALLKTLIWRVLPVSSLVVVLTACDGNEMLAGDVTGYNHMPIAGGWSIAGFTVNGAGGPPIQPESGGGKFSCCMSFPKHWHAGMKAKVSWFYDVKVGDPRTPPPPQEAEIDIPEYTPKTAGAVQVHFYPDHRVNIVISVYGLRHPRYPMSEEDKKPWTARTDIVGE
jgi:hypothetical protein